MKKAFLLTPLLVMGAGAARANAFTPTLIANVQAEGKSMLMTGIRGACSDKTLPTTRRALFVTRP
jgi:hypothetical protein